LPRYSFIEVRKLQNTSKHALAHISQEFSGFFLLRFLGFARCWNRRCITLRGLLEN